MQQNYYLGIDASKGYADFVILNQEKTIVEKNFQLDDTVEGHNRLYEVLSGFLSKHPNSKMYAAIESTGGYENNWFALLTKCQSSLNIFRARLNPFAVTHNTKATLKRVITDKESAKNIADYMISHPKNIIYNTEDYYASLKKQWSFIRILKKQKAQLLNHLGFLLYISNPEILPYCKTKISTWVLRLLTAYPTAKDLAGARVTNLTKIPFLTEQKATEIINRAKSSVASSTDNISRQTIKAISGQIIELKGLIDLNVKQMEASCRIPEVDLLKSFKGIDTYSAAGLMIEILSIERFSSVKKLASYFGIHPVFKQSGDGFSGYRMSKQGRKNPRALLYNIAIGCVSRNEHIKQIYAKHLSKGMPKMAALGAVMHKILRIIYGMLKNNKIYDPAIDNFYTEKSKSLLVPDKVSQIRRYQPLDNVAPISRRQTKKRKEQNKSQILKPLDTEQKQTVFTGS